MVSLLCPGVSHVLQPGTNGDKNPGSLEDQPGEEGLGVDENEGKKARSFDEKKQDVIYTTDSQLLICAN